MNPGLLGHCRILYPIDQWADIDLPDLPPPIISGKKRNIDRLKPSLKRTKLYTCTHTHTQIKFCFKLRKNATEIDGMFQTAFRPSCINRASVFEWHKRFKEGRESVRNDERCGRSKEVNTPELIGQKVKVRVTMLRF